MLLVVWAASFGLNECGLPEIDQDTPPHEEASVNQPSHLNNIPNTQQRPSISRQRKGRKVKVDAMLREILELIDFHGVMRRPTWDGVRVLLLVLPLMEGDLPCSIHHPHRAYIIYRRPPSREDGHAASRFLSSPSIMCPRWVINSIFSRRFGRYSPPLTGLLVRSYSRRYNNRYARRPPSSASVPSIPAKGNATNILNRNIDDLDVFQNTFPTPGPDGSNFSPGPSSVTLHSGHGVVQAKFQRGSSVQSLLRLSQLFSLPLQLSTIARRVHSVLTGPKAVRRAEEHGLVDAHGMREIWDDLDHCWDAFDGMRTSSEGSDTELYVSAWQVSFNSVSYNIGQL